MPLDISQANEGKSYIEHDQECKIDQHGYHIADAEDAVENLNHA
jgi:hypothetical protein